MNPPRVDIQPDIFAKLVRLDKANEMIARSMSIALIPDGIHLRGHCGCCEDPDCKREHKRCAAGARAFDPGAP